MTENILGIVISNAVTLLVSLTGFISSLYKIKKDTSTKIEEVNKKTQDQFEKETTAVKLGVQAMLRNQMIEAFEKYSALGYAPIYTRDNFENMWIQYEALGANGVMQDIHDKFMKLPIQE